MFYRSTKKGQISFGGNLRNSFMVQKEKLISIFKKIIIIHKNGFFFNLTFICKTSFD